MKKLLSLLLVLCMLLSVVPAGFTVFAAETDTADTAAETEVAETGANPYGLVENVQDGQILQCWLWSYNNISKNLQKIAEQGFSAIQVSPIQPIKESTKESWNTFQNSSWVIYQPVAFSIEDNYRNVQGTEAEFRAMCKEAHKYGIKVIVDTVFNHMANDMSGNTIHPWIPAEIRDNSDCWHDISKNITNFDSRYDTTHYCLTGLPDLNTANSIVQKHCTNFMKDAIDAGADGFRFDAVKHIETPSDSSSVRSNFWPNVLNAATEYAQDTRDFTPYYYGELLGSPGGSLSITAYTKYMSVSDPGSSDNIRNGVCNGNASSAATGTISNGAAKNKAVHWTESHDNHKDNGTNLISEHNINKTWAMIGSKNKVCGLYLARPEDMNTTMMGDADMTSWSYPEVRAVNRFKNAFVGQSEYLSSYNKLACVERGTTGMIIVNTGGSYYDNVKVPVHTMASGTYKDAITGNTFTVSGGYIKGNIGDTGIAVVYDIDNKGLFTQGNVTDFSIAGTMNNWDTNAHKLVAKDSETATVTMFLSAGTYNFKVTDGTLWYGNKGIIEDTTTEAGWTFRTSVDEKGTLKATGGKYTFTFNISTGKLVVMHEKVSDKVSDVYMMGTFNDWAETNPMVYADGTNTVSVSVEVKAGTYEFKIYNEGIDVWYGNTGKITDSTGDTPWTMKAGEDKCTLKATGGLYEFKYDLSTNKLSVVYKGIVIKTYTVTFCNWDGSVISTQTVEEGKSATAPANPVRESTAMYSYTFKGWDKTFSNITADTKVTAQYNQTINKYTVTFKDYDGKVLSTQVVEAGTAATAPADPVRENTDQYTYEFVGWDKNFSSVTKDMEVNAVYTQTLKTYVVTFVGFGGEELSVQDVEHGGSAMDPYVPDVDGYVFVGWDKSLDDIVEDTVITAIYNRTELPRYTVTFKDWDGTVLSTQSIEEGESAVAPETPVREVDSKYTYTFKQWDKTFSGVTQDLVVTAVYTQTLNKFTVIFKDFDGKELSSQTVEYGASAVAPADPEREGYKFVGWDKEFDNITADTVVTANYTKVIVAPTTGKLRIEVSGGTGFKISVNGGSLRPQGTYYNNTKTPIGASVTVVANMVDGVEFLGWMNESGAVVSASDTYNFIASGNDYLQAVYMTPVEDVNVVLFKNAKAAGGNGQLLDMQYYAAGDVVDFPDAPAQTGYVFTGWSMTSDEIQAKLSAGEDVVVTATWELAKIYIDVKVTGGTIVTAPQANGKYLAFNALTVVADTAPNGMKFAYWTNADGKIMSYDAQYKSYPAQSLELVAVFVSEDTVIDKKPIVFMEADPTTDGEKITYTMSWDVAESVGKVTAVGMVVVDKEDYDAETFYHGTTDTKVFDRALGTAQTKQKNTVGVTKSGSYYDCTYYAMTFVNYVDAQTGETVTIYSDMIEVTKPAP